MLPGMKRKFSAPLKRGVNAIYGTADIIDGDLEAVKETQFDFLMGQSYRQAQIALFQWLERQHGAAILGDIEARALQSSARYILERWGDLIVYSDGGRGAEIMAIANAIGVDNVLIIQLYREGCTFEKDIRSYIDIPEITTVRLHNNGSTTELLEAALKLIEGAKPGWMTFDKAV